MDAPFSHNRASSEKQSNWGGQPHTVIAVIGKTFDFREFPVPIPEVWTPFQLGSNRTIRGITHRRGRLKPGVTLEQAKARLAFRSGSFATSSLTLSNPRSFKRESLREALVDMRVRR